MSQLDKIELPPGDSGTEKLWNEVLKKLVRGLRGIWGEYSFTPSYTGGGTSSDMKVCRRGTKVWFTVSVVGASGDGEITLPATLDGDTAFIGYNCSSFGLDGETKAYLKGSVGDAIVTGSYRAKE